jgi:hypothetical protein
VLFDPRLPIRSTVEAGVRSERRRKQWSNNNNDNENTRDQPDEEIVIGVVQLQLERSLEAGRTVFEGIFLFQVAPVVGGAFKSYCITRSLGF